MKRPPMAGRAGKCSGAPASRCLGPWVGASKNFMNGLPAPTPRAGAMDAGPRGLPSQDPEQAIGSGPARPGSG